MSTEEIQPGMHPLWKQALERADALFPVFCEKLKAHMPKLANDIAACAYSTALRRHHFSEAYGEPECTEMEIEGRPIYYFEIPNAHVFEPVPGVEMVLAYHPGGGELP